MTVEERKAQRLAYKLEHGYMIRELIDALSEHFDIYEHYGLSRHNEHEINLLEKGTGANTDFSIKFSSYSEDYFATGISLEWFKSWFDSDRAYKKIEWCNGSAPDYIYNYYIVDYSVGYRELITKDKIIDFIIDFVIQYDTRNLSPSLARERKLRQILNY